MAILGREVVAARGWWWSTRVSDPAERDDFLSPRQTGRADFPHPAFTQTLGAGQYVSLHANLAGRPSLDLR